MENTTQLSITDLAMLKQFIDVATTRGAFRADEMSRVGTVYDKLNTFLQAVVAQAEAEQAQSKEETQGESND